MRHEFRIKVLDNGYTLCYEDPSILQANRSSDGMFKDPDKEFVFDDLKEVFGHITPIVEAVREKEQTEEFSAEFEKLNKPPKGKK